MAAADERRRHPRVGTISGGCESPHARASRDEHRPYVFGVLKSAWGCAPDIALGRSVRGAGHRRPVAGSAVEQLKSRAEPGGLTH